MVDECTDHLFVFHTNQPKENKKKLAFVCFVKQREEAVMCEKIAAEYHFDANDHNALCIVRCIGWVSKYEARDERERKKTHSGLDLF